MTRKWNTINDQSNKNYNIENEMFYTTEVLKSNLCDYNDAYILKRDDIISNGYSQPIQVAIETFAPFINCIM